MKSHRNQRFVMPLHAPKAPYRALTSPQAILYEGYKPSYGQYVTCFLKGCVYNSANLAMFMVNVSQALIRPMRQQWPAFSVNDLKAWFRGRKYVVETLKWLPEQLDSIFIDQVVSQMAELGRVNHAP